ncbi:SubName: Full=Uncharacterized protein {ECO:0000313/EMBL:CCA74751.1} [Serendipita indica DSM 11827]|nr:SubName: Full=Uncharacterized protein {ECO:0000313/EMBL:CCA74751.1} [Serendipita indica DSM 11827]
MAAARLAVLRALWSPTKTVPNLTVRDIRFIDFAALRHAGFDGVVFDKDNCLTHPREDAPVPHLVNTLREVTTVFPKHHVLVVSNSAGSYGDDVEWIEADAVERAFSRALKAETTTEDAPVHVLRHRRKKPSKKCAKEIYNYFEQVKAWRNPPLLSQPPTTSDAQVRITQEQDAVPRLSTAFTPFEASLTLNSSSSSTVLDSVLPVKPLRLPVDPATLPSASSTKPRLVFVGDRIMTDVLLANEMGAYSVLTTHLWKPNDVVFLRIIESTFLRMFGPTDLIAHIRRLYEFGMDLLELYPPEVSSEIIAYACLTKHHQDWEEVISVDLLLDLTLVSSTWQAFIIGTPGLWADIFLDSRQEELALKLALQCELSRDHALSISVGLLNSTVSGDFLPLLDNHRHRIQELTVLDEIQLSIFFNTVSSLPCLKSLLCQKCRIGEATTRCIDQHPSLQVVKGIYVNQQVLTSNWLHCLREVDVGVPLHELVPHLDALSNIRHIRFKSINRPQEGIREVALDYPFTSLMGIGEQQGLNLHLWPHLKKLHAHGGLKIDWIGSGLKNLRSITLAQGSSAKDPYQGTRLLYILSLYPHQFPVLTDLNLVPRIEWDILFCCLEARNAQKVESNVRIEAITFNGEIPFGFPELISRLLRGEEVRRPSNLNLSWIGNLDLLQDSNL